MLRPLLFALALLGLTAPAQAARFDLVRWLDEPDVKLVAVEVYSDYCEPCKAAAPRWEQLRQRYKDDGLKLVVINVDDYESDRQCKTLPWRPDLLICSPEAGERLGVCTGGRCKVPQAFLWSWQGNLLVSGQSHIDEVEAAIKRYLGAHPRVQVVAKDPRGKPAPALRRQVEAALGRSGKLTVVADAEQRKRLAAVRKASHGASKRDDQRCEVGAEVSANSVLTVERFEGGAMSMILADAVSGCQRAVSSVTIDKRGLDKAVQKATFALMSQLRQRDVQMPQGRRGRPIHIGGARQVDVREVDGGGAGWVAEDEALITIKFDSDPQGARVVVDGDVLCDTTPCTREVSSGRHRVEMALARYVPRERAMVLEAGSNVSWGLEPTFGTLTVRSEPSGVMVTVDGTKRGRTPVEGLELPEGAHTVVVEDRCHLAATREVTLPRAKTFTLDVPLKTRPAGLRVSAVDGKGDVVEADLHVDGTKLGPTSKTFTVPLCSKEVVLRHPMLGTWRQALSLREKRTARLRGTLSWGDDKPREETVSAPARPLTTAQQALLDRGGPVDYVKGLAALSQGAYDRAVLRLKKALTGASDESTTWQMLLAVAVAYEQKGEPVHAIEYYRRFEERSGPYRAALTDKWRQRRGLVQKAIEALRDRLIASHGFVTVDSRPLEALIFIDGERGGVDGTATTPFDFFLPPGTYDFRLERRGYETVEESVEVDAGRFRKVKVKLQRLGDEGEAAPQP